MQVFTTPSKIIITCNKWLAPALRSEVIGLGFDVDRVFQTGVELTGTVNDCIRLNLNHCYSYTTMERITQLDL